MTIWQSLGYNWEGFCSQATTLAACSSTHVAKIRRIEETVDKVRNHLNRKNNDSYMYGQNCTELQRNSLEDYFS